MAVQSVAATQDGRLAQLVRALPSHGRGQRFKSFVAHHSFSFSHHWSGTCTCRATFVLNLLFRSKWKQGFEPLHDSRLECDAVVGVGDVAPAVAKLRTETCQPGRASRRDRGRLAAGIK